jgi:protein-S-isoprenylcysteine O-methyltransferase Ste14
MENNDRPGVIAPPPLIFAGAFGIGYLLRNNFVRLGSPVMGTILAIVGLAIGSPAFVEMLRAHTNLNPSLPATALVTSGTFRISRNPLYLSMVFLYVGAALFFRLTAALVALPIALILLHFGVIRREERYLEAKFGDQYRAYRSRVRRWI